MNWQSSTGIVPMTEVGLAGREHQVAHVAAVGAEVGGVEIDLVEHSITAGPSIRQLRNVRPDRIR